MSKEKPSADEESVRKECIDASFSSFSGFTGEHLGGAFFTAGNPTDSSENESESSESSETRKKKDLIMAHLLRLTCANKADDLPIIISQLSEIGVVGDSVRKLTQEPSSVFDAMFKSMFSQEMNSSASPTYWKTCANFADQHSSAVSTSRILDDFEKIQYLGHGGFGHVVRCKNKVDRVEYAMKIIPLKDKLDDSILREVATLSKLQHHHVVRYYQAWFETGISVPLGDAASSFESSSSHGTRENNIDPTCLYIQMEYCPSTLREKLEPYNIDEELRWKIFRQILEGLQGIHAQSIVHRDLNPNNIFFDSLGDIKIGDFGLAKFLKLGELDLDAAVGVSLDGTGTGYVGTLLYRAPEIEGAGRPKVNQKADMYSLGVVLLELWHPFKTGLERIMVLTELKNGVLPADWANQYPEQAELVKILLSTSPSDRPSATELLDILDSKLTSWPYGIL